MLKFPLADQSLKAAHVSSPLTAVSAKRRRLVGYAVGCWWDGARTEPPDCAKGAELTTPGRHADGGGLYLVVYSSGSRRWARFDGRRREMGLGSVLAVSFARARESAAEARARIAEGIDPLTERHLPPEPVAPPPAPVTFGDVADAYMADRESARRNPKHRAQWH